MESGSFKPQDMEKPNQKASSRVVAIVGRPNVGKSSIFNRLARRPIAIVHDQPGVTRDRITTDTQIGDLPCLLMDTGGIGERLDDVFAEQVAAEVDIALATADIILFVVDGREGLTPIDQSIAKQIRRAGKETMVLANKLDHEKLSDREADFASLGFQPIIAVSAAHGRGFGDLESELIKQLRKLPAPEEGSLPIKLAVVGRPNVGKSSLINAILGDQRTMVSEIAGTTRDAIDVPCHVDGQDFLLIDTAGIRRKTRRDSAVEIFSVMRSERTIRRCDLCLFVVDCAGGITAQDRRIASMILKEQKPCIVLLNKFDLYFPTAQRSARLEELMETTRRELFFLPYAPLLAVSALKKQQLSRIFQAIRKVKRAAQKQITTGILNRLLEKALLRHPPPMKGSRRFKILYASLARTSEPRLVPVPHFILFVNSEALLSDHYLRYLESCLREESAFEGLPIHFEIRQRQKRAKV